MLPTPVQVLLLSKDAAPGSPPSAGPAASPPPELASCAAVRRKALELIEVVLRNGLVAPWTAIPSLVALATDPQPDVASKAVKVRHRATEKVDHHPSPHMILPFILQAFA